MSVDPIRYFETKGQVSTLTCAYLIGAVANNQQIVAAVTGKRIRVMGWMIQSSGAAPGAINFKSANGGTQLTAALSMPPNGAGVIDHLPITDTGYFETLTGEGLFCDIATTTMSVNIFYTTYTPG